MILAKEFPSTNIRKVQKKALNSNYTYSIFDTKMPLKMSESNLKLFQLHDNHKEIGVLLKNSSFLEKEGNTVLFENKKALAQSFQNQVILKLQQPDDWSYLSWIKMMEKHILMISPSFLMLPINNSLNTMKISDCNLVIQEFNSLLLNFTFTTDVVIYQRNEPLSSLAYLIQNLGFPTKTYLCLNLDSMETDFYSLKDIKEDILKFDISNRIAMIQTNKYSPKSSVFKEFLTCLRDDIIIFGENI